MKTHRATAAEPLSERERVMESSSLCVDYRGGDEHLHNGLHRGAENTFSTRLVFQPKLPNLLVVSLWVIHRSKHLLSTSGLRHCNLTLSDSWRLHISANSTRLNIQIRILPVSCGKKCCVFVKHPLRSLFSSVFHCSDLFTCSSVVKALFAHERRHSSEQCKHECGPHEEDIKRLSKKDIQA